MLLPSVPVIMELAAILEADSDELLFLAGKAPLGLDEVLRRSPGARAFFRCAIDRLTEDDWEALLAEIKKKGNGSS